MPQQVNIGGLFAAPPPQTPAGQAVARDIQPVADEQTARDAAIPGQAFIIPEKGPPIGRTPEGAIAPAVFPPQTPTVTELAPPQAPQVPVPEATLAPSGEVTVTGAGGRPITLSPEAAKIAQVEGPAAGLRFDAGTLQRLQEQRAVRATMAPTPAEAPVLTAAEEKIARARKITDRRIAGQAAEEKAEAEVAKSKTLTRVLNQVQKIAPGNVQAVELLASQYEKSDPKVAKLIRASARKADPTEAINLELKKVNLKRAKGFLRKSVEEDKLFQTFVRQGKWAEAFRLRFGIRPDTAKGYSKSTIGSVATSITLRAAEGAETIVGANLLQAPAGETDAQRKSRERLLNTWIAKNPLRMFKVFADMTPQELIDISRKPDQARAILIKSLEAEGKRVGQDTQATFSLETIKAALTEAIGPSTPTTRPAASPAPIRRTPTQNDALMKEARAKLGPDATDAQIISWVEKRGRRR